MSLKDQRQQALYRKTLVNQYEYPAHIFALDYYKPGSKGKDKFSRKEVWFHYLGGKQLKEEFSSRMKELFDDLFVNNSVDWDYFTVAPSTDKDGLNRNMLDLSNRISDEGKLNYRQVLRRSKGIDKVTELSSIKQKMIRRQSSIEVTEDVQGDNIIVINNVSVSGVYLAYLTKTLLDKGASRVACVCIGVTNHERAVRDLEKGTTAIEAMEDMKGGGLFQMNELSNLYLKEKPVKALIMMRQSDGETFCREISEDIESTYAHTVKIISEFKDLGVVNTRTKGRRKMLSLTEAGEKQADLLVKMVELCSKAEVATGGKIEEKKLFEK